MLFPLDTQIYISYWPKKTNPWFGLAFTTFGCHALPISMLKIGQGQGLKT